ncbi:MULTISPECIES: c-type cytochrome [Sulfurimonas]|uniref:c-type cytochrome n=1 Tax=Sulfurimonas TaxID=202746 RepID=UPI00126471FD|nr:c-type cytochrome [Sulfurimonas indica]
MKIILSVAVALFLLGCSDNKSNTQESKSVAPAQTEVVEKVTAVEKKTAPTEEKVVVAEEKTTPTETQESVVEEVVSTATTEAPKVETATPAVDGAKLFTVCSSCHGAHGEKKALGKSQIIQGWQTSQVVTALKGYQDGTYGGAMKGVMKGQAAKLSDAEINALAEYISKL